MPDPSELLSNLNPSSVVKAANTSCYAGYVHQEGSTEHQEGKIHITATATRKELISQKEQQTLELPLRFSNMHHHVQEARSWIPVISIAIHHIRKVKYLKEIQMHVHAREFGH